MQFENPFIFVAYIKLLWTAKSKIPARDVKAFQFIA